MSYWHRRLRASDLFVMGAAVYKSRHKPLRYYHMPEQEGFPGEMAVVVLNVDRHESRQAKHHRRASDPHSAIHQRWMLQRADGSWILR